MRVLISGLTGTLGTALAALHHSRGDTVFGCARSEARAVEWLRTHADLGTLFLCDARAIADPRTDIGRLLPTVSVVYHCAAMKHVDLCEQQPWEATKQNVKRVSVVASACANAGNLCVFVSSDKACLPYGTYGATKLIAENVALKAGAAVVRLGNLIGSSGSVFAAWDAAVKRGEPIKVTDPAMTRYFMAVDDAAKFIADDAVPGHVSLPADLLAARMGDVADAVASVSGAEINVTGPRDGETPHQWIVAKGEKVCRKRDIVILDSGGQPLADGMCSDTAPRWDVGDLLAVAGVAIPAGVRG